MGVTFEPSGNLTGGGDRPVRVVLSDDESLFRASLRQLMSVPRR